MAGRRNRAVAAAALALLVLAGCGNDDEGGATTSTDSTAAPGATGAACDVTVADPVEGCEVQAYAVDPPVELAELQARAADAGGQLVALWRIDTVCVDDVSPLGPQPQSEDGARRASAFAYWDAEEVVRRQDAGPPATDGGWSTALRLRFVEEWKAAREPGVLFAGVAAYVPEGAAIEGAEARGTVPSYRTDEVGVLYLRNHDEALLSFFPAPDTAICARE